MEDKFKLTATILLTELPVNVELYVDKLLWLTATPKSQAAEIQRQLYEKYPLNMRIAEEANEKIGRSYIDPETIKIHTT